MAGFGKAEVKKTLLSEEAGVCCQRKERVMKCKCRPTLLWRVLLIDLSVKTARSNLTVRLALLRIRSE